MSLFIVDILDQDLKSRARGRQEIDFDPEIAVQDAIDAIVGAFDLPRKDARGDDRRYMLGYQGNVLDLSEVLDHAVPAGATVVLTSDATVAGGPA